MGKLGRFLLFGFLLVALFLFPRDNSGAAQACQLQSAFWTGSDSSVLNSVAVNEPILLTVRSTGCKDWQISVNVWEDDSTNAPTGDDWITSVGFTLNGNSEQTFRTPGFTTAQYSKGKDGNDIDTLTMFAIVQAGDSQVKSGFFYLKPSSQAKQPPANPNPANPAPADKSVGAGGTEKLPGIDFTIQDVGNWITGLTCWTIQAVLAIMIIALVIAGVRYFIAGTTGDVASAKKNLTWVLIGIVVILGVNIIIATITKALGGSYSFLPLDCSSVSTKTNFPGGCAGDIECIDQFGEGFQCLPIPGNSLGQKQCSAPVGQ